MRPVRGLPTVGAGQLLTVLLLTRLVGLPIIRSSSLAPLFGPSLRRALNFSGGFQRGRAYALQASDRIPFHRGGEIHGLRLYCFAPRGVLWKVRRAAVPVRAGRRRRRKI